MEAGINSYLKEKFGLKGVDIRQYNALELAYIGDTVYDLVIRSILVNTSATSVEKLHQRATGRVSAKAQCMAYKKMEPLLTDEEAEIFKRGHNSKPKTKAKNATLDEYLTATGVETLVGYLYLQDKWDRIVELMTAGLSEN